MTKLLIKDYCSTGANKLSEDIVKEKFNGTTR